MQFNEQQIREDIIVYESMRRMGMAQTSAARELSRKIMDTLVDAGYEYCEHNMAYLGSTFYRDMNPRLNRLVTRVEYQKAFSEWWEGVQASTSPLFEKGFLFTESPLRFLGDDSEPK